MGVEIETQPGRRDDVGQLIGERALGDDDAGAGILQDCADALQREPRIDRDVGGACFQDAEHGAVQARRLLEVKRN